MNRITFVLLLASASAAVGCQTDSAGGDALTQCPEGATVIDGACVVPAPIRVGPDQIGPAQLGRRFVAQFDATGGDGPYSWTTQGDPPAGLALSDSGLLSGTPSSAGTVEFAVIATDLDGRVGQVALSLEVLAQQCDEVEQCNGVDDDCDGEIDEDIPGTGATCGPTEGVCQRGATACIDGNLVCDGIVELGEEVCDGEDNDCDGLVDEDVQNACGACGDVPAEVCDGEDNDCDGMIDEDLLNACGTCGDVPEEVCDGDDNDCDGFTDEDLLNACGTCGEVPEETCDGQDNNCDGEVDEGCPCAPDEREACGTDVGLCAPGERACVDGTWGPCEGATGPVPEVCDGADNNCDGQDDEGVLNACGTCGDVPTEVCDGQDNDCDGDTDEGVLNACGTCGPVPTELCDGQDNDCDGDTDEGLLNACGTCGPVPAEVCDGQDNDCDDVIDDGVLNACGECGPVPAEVCDGDDNDCNGMIDDGFGSLGDCENTNDDGTCTGQLRCVLGNEVCDADMPSAEVCDGDDNDCDDQVDEDADGQPLSQTCVVEGCQNVGASVCDDGAFGDCTFPPEVCDGDDNDCDGAVDEDIPGLGTECGGGPGVCAPGQTACTDGEVMCEDIVYGTDEVCDGQDNDCDGAIDNDPIDAGAPCTVERCGAGTSVCDGGDLVCDVPSQPPGVSRVPVESGFIRAYTGTEDPAIFDNDVRSYSVLITSDGERVYNVGYGIDGDAYAGWTIRTFVPTPTGLDLESQVEIPVDWDNTGAPRVGFAGVAAKDGVIYATQIAFANSDRTIWVLDPAAETAEVHLPWGNQRNTLEGPSEYDFTQDHFWTIQWLQDHPFVFAYTADNGIDPEAEEQRFRVTIPDGNDPTLGTIASDGVHLYASLYSTAESPADVPLWQFGSGHAGTLPGESPTLFTRLRPGAAITYHADGNIYAPDQAALDTVQRVPVTAGGLAEVCDGVDNDCDGNVDEGACQNVDLRVTNGAAAQVGNGFEVDVDYTVINQGSGRSAAYRDGLYLAHPDAPTQAIATLALLPRAGLGGFEFNAFSETVELPPDTQTGQWLLVVVVDQRNELGDAVRTNNFVRIPFYFASPDDCEPDALEPNDNQGDATQRNRNSTSRDLTICAGEDDWFRVRILGNGIERYFIQFDHDDGNLDMILYDDDGAVARAATNNDNESINFRNPSGQARDYYLRVFQTGTTNLVPYNLFLTGF
mgnify:CR=1 FL=1